MTESRLVVSPGRSGANTDPGLHPFPTHKPRSLAVPGRRHGSETSRSCDLRTPAQHLGREAQYRVGVAGRVSTAQRLRTRSRRSSRSRRARPGPSSKIVNSFEGYRCCTGPALSDLQKAEDSGLRDRRRNRTSGSAAVAVDRERLTLHRRTRSSTPPVRPAGQPRSVGVEDADDPNDVVSAVVHASVRASAKRFASSYTPPRRRSG